MPSTGEFRDFVGCSEKCPPGTIGTLPTHRNSSCGKPCPAGHYCEWETVEPSPCPPGTVAPRPGLSACAACAHPLSSGFASTSCSICVSGFYLRPSSNATDALAVASAEACQPCPPHADCSAPNTTLATLGVPPGYWRASTATTEMYRCYNSGACLGSQTSAAHARAPRRSEPTDPYCAEGHSGPRCELCIDADEYFSTSKRRCIGCPTRWRRISILGGVALGLVLLFAVLCFGATRLRKRSNPRRTAVLDPPAAVDPTQSYRARL